MKPKNYSLITLTLLSVLLLSCGQKQNANSDNQVNHQIETLVEAPTVYSIKGEDIVIRVGPGEKFDKLINKKASELIGKTHYTEVDYTEKVIIVETEGDWSKIVVVDPDWLSDTHVGWIPTKNIVMVKEDVTKVLEKLDPSSYEILKTEHNNAVENFHVLIKFSNFDKDKLFDFTNKFRYENCTGNCNIMVYDSKIILPLIDKYPLKGKEYIKLADHFVAMSTFDAPNSKSWYPYQDFQYKDYGGKNWK